MEDKNKNPDYANFGGGIVQPPSLGGLSDPSALSLSDASPALEQLPEQSAEAHHVVPNILLRLVKRADIILAILLVLSMIGVFLATSTKDKRPTTPTNSGVNSQFKTQDIALDTFISDAKGVSFGASSVVINGSLSLNGGLVVTPSLQPSSPKAGQLYYDQGTNQLAYYNGTQFVSLTASPAQQAQGVQSIGGLTGQVGLAGGLAVVGNQLINAGVLSLGGQSGAIVLGNGLNMTGNTLQNSGILDVVGGSGIQVTSNGNGSVTVSNIGAGSGTVSSSGGTAGRIPLFTSVQNIEDSLVSQSGSVVTVNGDLSVTGNLNLTSPLTVANGGTGTNSLAANGVIVGNGAGALSSVTAGGPGLCLLSTAGAPNFAVCPSASGVTSLNGLSGGLTIANASGVGSTITINDASTVAKGIASFNSTNFSVAAGAVNTIQNINSGATPTFAGVNTNNITNSAALTVGVSGQTALLQGSTTTITSNGAGNDIILNSARNIELQDNTNVTGNLATSGDVAVNGGDITSSGALNITPTGTLTAGSATQTFTLQGNDTSTLKATNGANTTIVGFTSPTANTTLNFPALSNGTYTICTTSGNCAGAGVTLQAAYNNSSTPEIVLDATRGALTIRDTLAGLGANLLEVQNNSGATTYLAVTSSGLVVTGTATISGSINSSGGALQTNGTTRVDNSGNLTNIGSITLSGAISGGTSVTGSGNFNTTAGTIQTNSTTRIDNSGNLTNIGNLGLSGTISGGTSITGSGNFNTTAGVIQTNSTTRIDNSGNLVNIGSLTASGNGTLQGGSLTLGTSSQAGSLVVNDGSSNTGTLQVAALAQNTVYTLPDPGSGTATICLDTGNCAGTGGGVTGSGTNNTVAKFTSTGGTIGDSIITDNGSTVTIGGTLAVNTISPTGAFTAGATGQTTTVQGSTTTITSNGAGNNIVLNSANTIELQDNTNVTGNLDVSGTLTAGTANAFQVDASGNVTAGTYNSNTFTSSNLQFGAAATATIQSAASQALTITGNAASTWSTSTGNLTVQAASDLNLKAAGGNVVIGTSDTTGTLLVLDVKTNAGDPTGTDGAIYYNSNAGSFRCYQGGTWTNCITASGGFVSLQNAYDNGNTISTDATGDIAFTLNNQNFTVATAAGASGSTTFSLTDGSNPSAPAQLVLINNNDINQALASGLKITSAAGGITTGLDVSGSNITNAIDVGANKILGTTAVIDFTNFDVASNGAITSTNNATLQGGSLTLGTTSQAGSVILYDGSSNTGTIQTAALGQNTTYTLPDPGTGTVSICLTTGNCAGTGGGVTGSGTNNQLAKFTSTGGTIGDSTISDDGSTVTTSVNLVVQGGLATVGIANSQAGTLTLADGGSAFSGSIVTTTLGANRTYTLPDVGGTFCLSSGNCLGGGGGGANTSLSNLTSVAINTSLLSGSSTIDLGSGANPFRDLYLGGAATNNFKVTGTATAARTVTLDDLSGHVALVQTAGSSSAQTGDINASGTLIAGTALQGTLFKSADGAGASSGVTFRSGSTTGGSGLSTGSVTIASGDGSGTNTSSGNVSIDTGAKTGTGTTGTITIGGTNASSVGIGHSGITTTNAGALTVSQQLTANGGISVAGGQNLTLQNGSGVLSQTYSSASASSAFSQSVTNSNAGASSVAVNAYDLSLVGTATSGGTNTNTALKFENPTAQANNVFYGMNFVGTGYTDVLRVNGNQIISGAGKFQNAGFDSTVNYANLTQVNTLTALGGTLTVGTTSQQGSLVLHDGNGQTATISVGSALAADTALAIPTGVGATDTVCLQTLANCLGGAGGGANVSLSNLSAVAINTSLLPGTTTIDLGSGAKPFRDLYLGGTATNNFRFTGTASAARTYTMDDLSGSIALVQTGGSSSAQTGDINVSGTLIAGTALQSTLIKTADGAGASSAITFRSGNTTGGSGLSTGSVSIKSGDGSGTNTSSGNISIDTGTATGSGTTGTITLGNANASALTLGHSGLTTNNAGSLTVAELLTASSGATLNKTLTANSGGTQNVATVNFSSPTDSSGTNISQGLNIATTIGNATAGTNTANIINLGAVTGDAQVTLNAINVGALTGTGATETAINIGAGWDNILTVGGTPIINGSGVVQSAGISGSYTGITGVGTLTAGALGSGFTIVNVAQGGTGAGTFTNNGVLYGNGTGAIQATTAGTTGQCLVGNTGLGPTWSTCTGLITLQNAYDNGNVINTTNGRNIAFNLTDQAVDPNFLVDLQCDISCGTDGRFAVQDDGVDVFSVSPAGGAVKVINSVNSTTGFNIKSDSGSGSNNIFTVDTSNTRVGIGLGGNNVPNLSGQGLELHGALNLTGTGSTNYLNDYTTPLGSTLSGRITINNDTYGGSSQSGIYLGILSGSDSSARGVTVLDARSSAHQPSIAVISPDESKIFGLSWDGSNATSYLKTSASSTNITTNAGDVATFNDTSVSLLQNTVVAANKNLTLQSGSGVFAQTFTSSSAASAQTLSVTNSNAGASAVAVNGQDITLVGTATSGGINTNSAIKFENPTAQANNQYVGLNFAGTGYTDILRVNGTQIINGTGVVQSAGINGSYSNLTGTGTLTSGALGAGFTTVAVGQGGTGATSFTSNGVLYGNNTGAIQATAAGTTGQCLVANTGAAPTWTTCTGLVTLQNAYNNSTNPEIVLNGTNGALTVRDNSTPIGANLLEVQNNAGTTTYLGVSSSTVALGTDVDLTLTGTNAFISNPQGTTNSEVFGNGANSSADRNVIVGNGSGGGGGDSVLLGFNIANTAGGHNVIIGSGAGCTNNGCVAIGADSTLAGFSAVALGDGAQANNNNAIALGSGATTTANNQLVIGANGGQISDVYIGNGVTNAAPANVAINATGGSGTDIQGASLTLAGGKGTGAGNGGAIVFQIATPSGSGGTLNTLTSVATINGTNGGVLLQNATNSAGAFQIQNAIGSNAFAVDTTPLNALVANGSLEGSSNTGWALKGSSTGTAARSSLQAYSGSFSERVALTSTGNADGVQYTPTSFSANTTYMLSFDIKQTAGTDFTSNFAIGYNNGSDHTCTINPSLSQQSITAGMTGWFRYYCTFTTAASPAPSFIFWKETDTPASARTFFLDAVQLEQTSNTTPQPFTESKLQLNGVVNSPVSLQNVVDSTTAFQIQSASGANNIFTADTLNGRALFGNIVTSNTTTNAAQVLIQANANNRGLAIQSNGTQDALDIYNSTGTNVAGFDKNGSLTVSGSGGSTINIGNISSNIAGTLNLADANNHQLSIQAAANIANSHTIQLDTSLLTATRSYTFPDVSGTICTTGAVCAGYANTALSNLASVAINTALGFQSTSAANINFNGAAAGAANSLTITGQTGGASNQQGGAVTVQGGTASGFGAGGLLSLLGGLPSGASGTNGGVTIDTGNVASAAAGTISIGSSGFPHNINIGNGGSGTQTVQIGTQNTNNSTSIFAGTGGVMIDATGQINIGSNNAPVVNIGPSSVISSQAATINLGPGGNAGGAQTVTVGSQNSGSTLTLQASTGASAITFTTGASAGTAGGIQIGNTTGANSQTINIGNNNTAGSTTNVTIGSGSSATAGTTTVQAKGAVNITAGAASTFSTTAGVLTIQGAAGLSIGTAGQGNSVAGRTTTTAGLNINDPGDTTAFTIQGSSATNFVTVDSAANKFYIGNASNCNGRFCVENTTSNPTGSTFTNSYNSSTFTGTSTAGNNNFMISQDIVLTDTSTTSGGGVNTLRGIRIDMSGTNNTGDTLNGILLKIPSTTSNGSYSGNTLQIQNGAVNILKQTNIG
ncbi:MAG TPA: hypothetical protein VL737_04670, partial [Candidatus Pristimantibacillus sp.]|nr:hypothetical protein [Candidatus Pristimantibacillus sp.]